MERITEKRGRETPQDQKRGCRAKQRVVSLSVFYRIRYHICWGYISIGINKRLACSTPLAGRLVACRTPLSASCIKSVWMFICVFLMPKLSCKPFLCHKVYSYAKASQLCEKVASNFYLFISACLVILFQTISIKLHINRPSSFTIYFPSCIKQFLRSVMLNWSSFLMLTC